MRNSLILAGTVVESIKLQLNAVFLIAANLRNEDQILINEIPVDEKHFGCRIRKLTIRQE
jgi:hypothetical protein